MEHCGTAFSMNVVAMIEAYRESHCGYSADRVVCDPGLNQAFRDACERRGMQDTSARDLNRGLINLRKAGKLNVRTSRVTRFDDSEYRFAAEMAARHLERRDHLTLDDVLCDPELVAEFDQLCSELSPGYSPLEYRWAALSLRKQRGLCPEILSHVCTASRVTLWKCRELETGHLPTSPGLYVFIDGRKVLYVGEASNLRTRLKKHLTHSDNRFFARWLWENGFENVMVEIHELDINVSTKVRRALELELIRSRQPSFNIIGQLGVDDLHPSESLREPTPKPPSDP